jgi:anaerobic sulfite reductase subunit B
VTTTSALATPLAERHVGVPRLYRVAHRRLETSDVVTLLLAAIDKEVMAFRPGQFNMLSAPGVGEIAISLSDAPRDDGLLHHSIRDVGLTSHALCSAKVSDVVGVRGPFGSDWQIPDRDGESDESDVVLIAGGVGLAPLRGAANRLMSLPARGAGRVFILVGAREPGQILFSEDLATWSRAGAHVQVTVDHGAPGWSGRVGLVTTLLSTAGFDPTRTRALICGPEIMMRFTARALEDMGVDPARILVSLERNMQCGNGWCGHCQLGPYLLCRDGPVLTYDGAVRQLLIERER